MSPLAITVYIGLCQRWVVIMMTNDPIITKLVTRMCQQQLLQVANVLLMTIICEPQVLTSLSPLAMTCVFGCIKAG